MPIPSRRREDLPLTESQTDPPAAMPAAPPQPLIAVADGWHDYALLDSGGGRKLERFGAVTVIRPEPQAIWKPALAEGDWAAADAAFEAAGGEEGGRWQPRRRLPEAWEMTYGRLRFRARLTPFRHLGVFPEQAPQWDWLAGLVARRGGAVRVLNLFGYTGLASVAAAAAGAQVTHVDAARRPLDWTSENKALSGLADAPIRIILDDALKFARREVRRGSRYEGLILDPPKFGRGPKGETWKLFDDLPELLATARALLAPQPLFVVLTAYAIRASCLSLHYGLADALNGLGGHLESGEMAVREAATGRVLPAAIFSRWSAL